MTKIQELMLLDKVKNCLFHNTAKFILILLSSLNEEETAFINRQEILGMDLPINKTGKLSMDKLESIIDENHLEISEYLIYIKSPDMFNDAEEMLEVTNKSTLKFILDEYHLAILPLNDIGELVYQELNPIITNHVMNFKKSRSGKYHAYHASRQREHKGMRDSDDWFYTPGTPLSIKDDLRADIIDKDLEKKFFMESNDYDELEPEIIKSPYVYNTIDEETNFEQEMEDLIEIILGPKFNRLDTRVLEEEVSPDILAIFDEAQELENQKSPVIYMGLTELDETRDILRGKVNPNHLDILFDIDNINNVKIDYHSPKKS